MEETYQVAMTLHAYNDIFQMKTVKHRLVFPIPPLRKVNVKQLARPAPSDPRNQRRYVCHRATRLPRARC